jgi:PTS system mannose-specific IIA component
VSEKPGDDRQRLAPLGLILTHGRLGEELKQTAELILGSGEGVVAVSNVGCSSAVFAERVDALVAAEPPDRPILLFVDLLGGSCSQASGRLLQDGRVRLLTGVNLPMVLAFLQYRESMGLEELVTGILMRAHRGITAFPAGPVAPPAPGSTPAVSHRGARDEE